MSHPSVTPDVTSDFHMRRAPSIFRNEAHGKTFSIAAQMMTSSSELAGGRTGSGPRSVPTIAEALVVKRRCPMALSRIARLDGKCNRSAEEFSTENGAPSAKGID